MYDCNDFGSPIEWGVDLPGTWYRDPVETINPTGMNVFFFLLYCQYMLHVAAVEV